MLDPHKGLFLPYGTGAVLIRDGQALRRAHSLTGDYMPGLQDDPDRVDFSQYSPELSRPFRGLRVWLPLKMHGAGAFREQLDGEAGARPPGGGPAARRWRGSRSSPSRSSRCVAFRLAPAGVPESELNALNQRFLDRVNARQRVYLTATRLRGRFAPRICVLSFRTHRDRLEMALEDIAAAQREVLDL